jgi:parallel beta-helix repeat protein
MKRWIALVMPLGMLLFGPRILASAAAATPTGLSCGATVTTSVTLSRDLLNCPVDGLVVGASGITINLNGHRITGTSGDGSGDPNRCRCGINDQAGFNRITLFGGRIERFFDGADFIGTRGVVVHDLVSSGLWEDGLYLLSVTNVLVTDSQFSQSFRGVDVDFGSRGDSRGVTVRNASFTAIGHAGVAMFGTFDSAVRNNTMTLGGGDYGVEIVNSSNNVIADNQIRRWGQDGVVLVDLPEIDSRPALGNAINDNDLRNGANTGIELVEVDGGTVRNNLVSGNDTVGTPADGILVDGLTSRTHDGSCPCDLVIGAGPSSNRIRNNTSNGNAHDGIHLDAPGNLIAGNVANRNGRWGIYAYPGNTDGGGNRASGNGQPAQCSGVVCA